MKIKSAAFNKYIEIWLELKIDNSTVVYDASCIILECTAEYINIKLEDIDYKL